MRISELPNTAEPDLDFLVPASRNDGTYALTLRQVRLLMQFAAVEVSYGSGTVQSSLDALSDDKADARAVYTKDEIDDARWDISKLSDIAAMRVVGSVAGGAPQELAASEIETILAPVRAGEMVFLPGGTIPSGRRLVKLNGATLSRTAYPYLLLYAQDSGAMAATEAAKTAVQFGPGNGSTTFTLPDWRGYFMRAWDDGRGVDTGRVISALQAAATHSHYHELPMGWDTNSGYLWDDGDGRPIYGSRTQGGTTRSSFSKSAPSAGNTIRLGYTGGDVATSGETRPMNLAALFAIRF